MNRQKIAAIVGGLLILVHIVAGVFNVQLPGAQPVPCVEIETPVP